MGPTRGSVGTGAAERFAALAAGNSCSSSSSSPSSLFSWSSLRLLLAATLSGGRTFFKKHVVEDRKGTHVSCQTPKRGHVCHARPQKGDTCVQTKPGDRPIIFIFHFSDAFFF